MVTKGLLIIIPLYKAPELLRDLVRSLQISADEINSFCGKVLFINDSPDDISLSEAIEAELTSVSQNFSYRIIENKENMGFIKSINKGLTSALEASEDVILLNSDALITKGAVTEMIQVAYVDPLISVVSPRSNNATICNSPYADSYRLCDFDTALKAHKHIAHHLDRITYVPTGVGFCLFIKVTALKEFGVFDEVYRAGYNEENDFIMRCNRFGYRAVLANRAFVYHLGSVSFDLTDEGKNSREKKNRKILDSRFPEYKVAIDRYFHSTQYRAQLLLSSMVPDENHKLNINFDCNNIGDYYNGTFEHALSLIKSFASLFCEKYNIYISCNRAAYHFHNIGNISGVYVVDENSNNSVLYAISFRIGQAFDWYHLLDFTSSAPITGYLMLDTIAMDCNNLDHQGLESLWTQMLNMSSIIGFNSSFTKDQFFRRFPKHPHVTEFVSLCSTSDDDYTYNEASTKTSDKYILVIGNPYSHKNLKKTVRLFESHVTKPKIIVLGLEIEGIDGITGYASGHFPQEDIDHLYNNASVIVFPSFYEGFGLPIVRAIARKVPIIARNLPVFEEIRTKNPNSNNVYLFETTEEIVEFSLSGISWSNNLISTLHVQTWDSAAKDMEFAFSQALRDFNFNHLKRRLDFNDIGKKWLLSNQDLIKVKSKQSVVGSSEVRSFAKLRNMERISCEYIDSRFLSRFTAQKISNYIRLVNFKIVASFAFRFIKPLQFDTIEKHDLKKSEILPNPKLGNLVFVDGGTIVESLNIGDFQYRLLTVSEMLRIGWMVYFAFHINKGSGGAEISLRSIEGVKLMCSSAGLNIINIKKRFGVAFVLANKTKDWSSCLDFESEDREFLSDVYYNALERELDTESEIWLRHLKDQTGRHLVAKRVFSSPERISILLEDLQSVITQARNGRV